MLTELYIEALLVDEELADQVWSIWDQCEIDDCLAWIAWLLIIKDFSQIAQICAKQDFPVGLYLRNRPHIWNQDDKKCADLTI